MGRSHLMEKLGFDLDGSSPAKQINPQEARKLSIQRCIQSLVHACQCRDANCRLSSCPKMKRVVMHTKICKRKTNGDCPICKQLITLCCYHAKHCKETKCLVPFCRLIKRKIKQLQLERLQQVQLLRKRMAVMNTRPSESGGIWRKGRSADFKCRHGARSRDEAWRQHYESTVSASAGYWFETRHADASCSCATSSEAGAGGGREATSTAHS